MLYRLELKVPFETARQAEIARDTLRPDPVLKDHETSIEYSAVDSVLVVTFTGISDRVIRVAILNCIDNIKVIIETMDVFDGKKDVKWEVEPLEE